MVTLHEVEQQLAGLGVGKRFQFWGHAEIVELQHILIPGERIQACLNGHYEGGFAVLCATDQRLLLIDKKFIHLSVEDIRYDMITEVDYGSQLVSASARICTPTKNLKFTAIRPRTLRALVNYVQQRVLEVRHQYANGTAPQQFQQQMPQQFQQQPQQPQIQAVPPLPVAQTFAAHDAPNQTENVPALPTPPARNPYMSPPLMIRRRVGRFATGLPGAGTLHGPTV
jgi:hypothetical protein